MTLVFSLGLGAISRHFNIAEPHVPTQQQNQRRSRRLHAGQLRDATLNFAAKIGVPPAPYIPPSVRRNSKEQQIVARKAHIRRLQIHQRPYKKPCAEEQHNRKRHLRHHERFVVYVLSRVVPSVAVVCFSAGVNSTRVARSAGVSPKRIPVTTQATAVNASRFKSGCRSIESGLFACCIIATSALHPQ